MTDPSVIQHDKNMLHRWFGTNRGTHWTVASSVMVIILGGYFIYSSRDSNHASGDTTPAVEQTPVPASSAPRN